MRLFGRNRDRPAVDRPAPRRATADEIASGDVRWSNMSDAPRRDTPRARARRRRRREIRAARRVNRSA